MSVSYITRQQRAVLACIESCSHGCATAAELAQRLHGQGEAIGLTTVYRQLEKLEKQGMVHKIVTDEGAQYQFCDCRRRGHDCFLMKCERCGKVEHMDCDHLAPLYAHMYEAHHFQINPQRTLFYGLCQTCAEGTEEQKK